MTYKKPEIEHPEGYCENEKCQECCCHDDVDHYICMNCEKELDPPDLSDCLTDFYYYR